jgi:hypothetical protein
MYLAFVGFWEAFLVPPDNSYSGLGFVVSTDFDVPDFDPGGLQKVRKHVYPPNNF